MLIVTYYFAFAVSFFSVTAGKFVPVLNVSGTFAPAGLTPVSYTHLDVYKRQAEADLRAAQADLGAASARLNSCLLYTSATVSSAG